MTKFILTFFLLCLTPALAMKSGADQPMLTEFLTETHVVYENLASMLESAMHSALQGDLEDLHLNEATRRIVMTKSVENYLSFDVETLDEDVVDADPEHFVQKVVALFDESSMQGLTVHVESIEESRPDQEETSAQLKMLMIGYYFGVLKASDFDTSVQVDWRWNEIQEQMKQLMAAKINSLMQELQRRFHAEISLRAQNFTASFKANHKQVVVILKSFKAYASQILIAQLRTFYFSLTVSTADLDQSNLKQTFQRTVDMWMVAYKLCERDCEPQVFARLLPDFLEEMLLTRIEQNDAILANRVTKTFWVKFLSFLFQQNFQNNQPDEESEMLRNDNERYAMFIYRTFFSREKQRSNDALSTFMTMLHAEHGLNYLYPAPELKQTDSAEFDRRVELNRRYIVDLVLFLDFPEFDTDQEYTVESSRTQEISFSDEEVLTLVQGAPVWFSFDLKRMNSEDLVLNWFIDFHAGDESDDYVLMYETLMEFRRTYEGSKPGQDLDVWLGEYLVDGVDEMDREDPVRQHRLAQFWIMKAINMINILSGSDYDEMFANAYPPLVNEDIILYFRRIVNREEFGFLKRAMLRIFAYYKGDEMVYSTDVDNDKFLYDVFEMSIECEKLPEILGTEVNIITIAVKDDESPENKKRLDDGSTSQEEVINVTSSESSSLRNNSSPNKSTQTHEEIVEVSSNSSQEVEVQSKKTPVHVVDESSNQSSVHVKSQTTEKIEVESSSNNSSDVSSVSVKESPVNKQSTKTPSHVSKSNVTDNESQSNRSGNHPVVVPSILPKKTSTRSHSESSSNVNVLPIVPKTSPSHKSQSTVKDKSESVRSSNSTPKQVLVETSSNSSSDTDEDEIRSNQSHPNKKTSQSIKDQESEDSRQKNSENSSGNSETLNRRKTGDRSQEDLSNTTGTPKNQVIETESNQSHSPVVSVHDTSSNQNESSRTSGSQVDQKTPAKKDSHSVTPYHWSQRSSEENSPVNRKSKKTSTNNSIYSEIESNLSSGSQHKVIDPQPSQKTHQEDSSESTYKSIPNPHPLVNNSSESSSTVSEHDTLPADLDNKRKNLVYEVSGRLTPQQRKTFEFADDVIASVKAMDVQVDEYGVETEYVYVQIVQKDSDCYQELLKFVNK